MELVFGMVREPPAPSYGHQNRLTHLGALLDAHVRTHRLGQVCWRRSTWCWMRTPRWSCSQTQHPLFG